PTPMDGRTAVLQSFKILEAMVIPIGIVIDPVTLLENNSGSESGSLSGNGSLQGGKEMITSTQFTAASDLTSLKFYYRTMDNSRIRCLDLCSINFAKVKYRSIPLDTSREQFEMIRL
ncbi:MAG: hypothetical protein ACI395_02445, partial [Candidatus Cryptobacteroides sp.]